MITIKTKYGYSVDCYGIIGPTSTIDFCCDDEESDGITESSFESWDDAVAELSDYAHAMGTELVQLCSDD